ncbi:MAG: hypothetical protein JJE30_15060 [Desulfuromonadales bacterium]|nr:hypothetical protein [Desulfuromonadales bacterium]
MIVVIPCTRFVALISFHRGLAGQSVRHPELFTTWLEYKESPPLFIE